MACSQLSPIFDSGCSNVLNYALYDSYFQCEVMSVERAELVSTIVVYTQKVVITGVKLPDWVKVGAIVKVNFGQSNSITLLQAAPKPEKQ